MKRRELVEVALGHVPPDLVIRNVTLVNVMSREIHAADIVVKSDRIAAVLEPGDSYPADVPQIDGQGLYAVPGFIDPHVHLESSMISVAEYARAVIPRGTTTVAADPHEIGNVLGSPGMRALFDEAATTPLRVKLRVPGRIPAVPAWMETSNGELTVAGTREMLGWPEAVCLAGDINPNLVLGGDQEQFDKFEMVESMGLPISGQSPGLTGRPLSAFVAAGPEDSHVAGSVAEIIESTRAGARTILALRPGRRLDASHMAELVRRVKADRIDSRLFQVCTDDIHAHDLLHEGHLDHRLRTLMNAGFDPAEAFQFATINVAQGLRISSDHGSISPGKLPDIVLLTDLRAVSVVTTIIAGKVVFSDGTYHAARGSFRYPGWTKSTIRYAAPLTAADLAMRPASNIFSARVRCLVAASPGKAKSVREEDLQVEDGIILPDPGRNINAVAMIERHKASGEIGRGFADCIRIKRGAIACSVNHDAHNVAVFGASHADMALAANRLADIGGGYVLACDGDIVAELALPIAGLMSEEPIDVVAAQLEAVEAALRDVLGAEDQQKALINMNFLSLPNIPNYGFTNKGLVASDGRMALVDSLVCYRLDDDGDE
jgi:adenine deaminase